MDIKLLIGSLEKYVENPTIGLPEELFLFVSRITPMVNVDLLVKNNNGEILLTWRDDEFHVPGWHIPGGIIRYKEKIKDRIKAVARNELGADIEFNPTPLIVSEIIQYNKRDRGHFISMLHECRLISSPDENLHCINEKPKVREWKWHSRCPENLIRVHHIYKHIWQKEQDG